MKKMIVIEACKSCDEVNLHYNSNKSECERKQRSIPDYDKIPTWCPLQDAPEEDS
jgi:hypothetical protein